MQQTTKEMVVEIIVSRLDDFLEDILKQMQGAGLNIGMNWKKLYYLSYKRDQIKWPNGPLWPYDLWIYVKQ